MSEPVRRDVYVSYFWTSKDGSGFGSSAMEVEGKMDRELLVNIMEDLKQTLKKESVVVLSWQPMEA